jgi:hypothetical protein
MTRAVTWYWCMMSKNKVFVFPERLCRVQQDFPVVSTVLRVKQNYRKVLCMEAYRESGWRKGKRWIATREFYLKAFYWHGSHMQRALQTSNKLPVYLHTNTQLHGVMSKKYKVWMRTHDETANILSHLHKVMSNLVSREPAWCQHKAQ